MSGTTEDVVFDALIDNARMCSDNLLSLCAAWSALKKLCAYVGITVGEETPPSPNAEPYVFLGIRYDHAQNSVRLADKSIIKLLRAAEDIRLYRDGNIDDVLAVFGLCIWGSAVTDFPMARVYYIFKFIRRLSRKRSTGSEPVSLWNCIRVSWRSWIAAVCAETRIHATPERSIIAFTDASLSGWGAVIFKADVVKSLALTGLRPRVGCRSTNSSF